MKKDKAKKIKHYSGAVFQTFTWVSFAVLLLYVLFIGVMLYFSILTSFKSDYDFNFWPNAEGVLGNRIGLPRLDAPGAKDALLFANFKEGLGFFNAKFDVPAYFSGSTLINSKKLSVTPIKMLWNSLLFVIVASLITTFTRLVMGYLMALYRNKISAIIYTGIIVVMVIPIVGTTPAMLTLLRNLRIYDKWIGYFLMSASWDGMYTLIFFEFFLGMSASYQEAAEIDGASQMKVMFLIYFPLAMKMFSTIFLIKAIEAWNNYNNVMLYMPSHPTLTYGVYIASFGNNVDQFPHPQRIASSMFVAIPTMIVFFIFKDRIMGNMSLGGLKE